MRCSPHRPIARLTPPRRAALIGAALSVAVATAVVGPSPAAATAHHRADATVVITWNAIAARTIFTENLTPIPSSGLYFGFVGRAVLDAVSGDDESQASREYHGDGDGDGFSREAAAATAAYRVLVTYFPGSAAQLEADRAATVDVLPADAARRRGIAAGEAAAARVIASRVDDGRGAAITLTPGTLPGQWRPTPDAFAPMLVPWLGFVRPLVLSSPTQIRLPGPDALGSVAYARDFAEVKDYGAKTGSLRSPAQTETALFFTANAVAQYQEAMREQVTRRGFGITAAARAFSLLGTATADSLIACWRAKYDYAFWRPVTAIRLADTDGNPATVADPTWTPLVATPPYGDYVSGHACVTGAAVGVMSRLFGTEHLDIRLTSSVTGTTRVYPTAASLDADTMNARIWLGLHFRRAMTDGNRLGHRVADIVVGQAEDHDS